MIQPRHLDRLQGAIRQELVPYPGRAAGMLHDTLGMVLALLLAEILHVPGIALSLSLILLLQRENAAATLQSALVIFGGAAAAAASCLVWVQVTDGTEVFRIVGFVLGILVAAFGMAASRFPLFFTMFGFYGFVDLAMWDTHRRSSGVVEAVLYNLAALAIALGCISLVNLALRSRHPRTALLSELRLRLEALASFAQELAEPSHRRGMGAAHQRLLRLAAAGDAPLTALYNDWASRSPETLPPGIRFRIGLLTRALEKSVPFGFATGQPREALREEALCLLEVCRLALHGADPSPAELSSTGTFSADPGGNDIHSPTHADAALRSIRVELERYVQVSDGEQDSVEAMPREPSLRLPVWKEDAFRKPDAALYALRLTLCATVCYLLYNAFAWPGILTCVVTVLFTGLSSTGAMKQKQLFRLSGAAIGGAIAILVESVLMPQMDSITALLIVAGCVFLLAAWVSRSPRIGYVGVQIAFAFCLAGLTGFTATINLTPARDRVVGIALGIAVMWFVFDQVWPVRSSDALRALRDRMQTYAVAADPSLDAPRLRSLNKQVSDELAQMKVLAEAVLFDAGRGHKRELARCRPLIRETERAAEQYYRRVAGQHR